MRVNCSCGKVLNVNDNLLGKRIKCPQCGGILRVGEERPQPVEEIAELEPQWESGKQTAVAEEETEPEAPPPKKKSKAPAAMLAKNKFIIKDQVKLLSSKKTYEIDDGETGEVLALGTQKTGALAAILGAVMGKDKMSMTLEFRQKADDAPVFSVRRSGFLFKKVQILDAAGNVLGLCKTKKLSLTGGFHLYDKAGKHYCEIRGKMLGSNYKIMTPDGKTEMGSVSKSWGGMAKALLTGANTFGVEIAPPYAGDSTAKTLILGAAVAVDAMFKPAGKAAAGGGNVAGGGDE